MKASPLLSQWKHCLITPPDKTCAECGRTVQRRRASVRLGHIYAHLACFGRRYQVNVRRLETKPFPRKGSTNA